MAAWTLITWCVAGLAVAGALARRERQRSATAKLLRAPLHVLFWPLFVPTLLPEDRGSGEARGRSSWDERIELAEAMLGEALRELGRDLEDPLTLEWTRVAALGRAMRSAAARVAELEVALAQPAHDAERIRRELANAEENHESTAIAEVLRRQLAHVERLEMLRRGAQLELERAIAEAGALASRLTLLRYEDERSGSTATRARELTDTVEELCRVLAEARAA